MQSLQTFIWQYWACQRTKQSASNWQPSGYKEALVHIYADKHGKPDKGIDTMENKRFCGGKGEPIFICWASEYGPKILEYRLYQGIS